MIKRVVIKGYRRFKSLDISPNLGMNIIVGDNESGKSTLLEAIALALTGKVNGQRASDELHPFWFNHDDVEEFFRKLETPDRISLPEILIELYLTDSDELQTLRGVHNSAGTDCPGVLVRITPSDQYSDECAAYLEDSPPAILPVEFYHVDWRDFSDRQLNERPKALATAFIDSRTIRSTSGVDYYTRQMLSENLDSKERASISVAHRKAKQQFTDNTLKDVNVRIAKDSSHLLEQTIGLQMDQSSRTSWETDLVPQVDEIPFAMAGQGQQAAIKVALAMSRTKGSHTFVLIEEPENHLAYGSLQRLVDRIEKLAATSQQLFVTTHSSFVLNRLGLDKLLLLHDGHSSTLTGLQQGTINYFRKLSGYDTLRLVLANKLALVEGPSDCIVLERAYRDVVGNSPDADGIDIVSMNGLAFKRAFELCASLDRKAVGLQDNDGRTVAEVQDEVKSFLSTDKRSLLVSDPANGPTLEPQITSVNEDRQLRKVLARSDRADLTTWMANNKTEASLLIFDSTECITFPSYITEAVYLLR